MRFMSIYHAAEQREPSEEHMAEMGKLIEEMSRKGILLSTGALAAERTRVRYENGKTTVTDGPFSESKEVVAGYAVTRYATKEEAIEGTKTFLRRAGDGQCEVRPIFETEDFPESDEEQAGGWRDQEIKLRDGAKAPGAPFFPPKPAGKRRFMMLVRADAFTESEGVPSQKLLTEMVGLMQELSEKKALLAGDGLKPTKEGSRVTLSKGNFSVTDGPFTEAKELIAGYTTIEVSSKEEAIAYASRQAKIHGEGIGAPGEIELRELL